MRCTLFRCVLAAPAFAVGLIIFTLCLLRGRREASPRLRAQFLKGAISQEHFQFLFPGESKGSVTDDQTKRKDPAGSVTDKSMIDQATLGAEVRQRLRNSSKPAAREVAVQLLEVASFHKHSLSVLQVGACDGEWDATNDPIQPLLSDPGVHALLMEPVPPTFVELRKRMMALPQAEGRLLALNAALCPASGAKSLPFYAVSSRYAVDHPDAPHWAKREIGSLLRSHLEKHEIPNEYIEEIPVPCRTALQVFQEAGTPVARPGDLDVLIVDAEGMDDQVVKAFLELPGFRPAMLIFERQHITVAKRKQVVELLRLKHYFVWNDHRNTVALLDVPKPVLIE